VLSRVKRSLRAARKAVLAPGSEAAAAAADGDEDDEDVGGTALFPGIPPPHVVGRETDAHGAEGDEEGDAEEEEEDDEGEDELDGEDAGDDAPPVRRRRLPTEDTFFRLDDMEKFVEDAEKAEAARQARQQRRGGADGDDDDDAIDGDDDDGDGGGDDEEEMDDEELFFGAGPVPPADDDADPDLDAAVAFTNALAGGKARKATAQKQRRSAAAATAAATGDGDGDGDDALADGIRYEDFFGPRKRRGRGGDDSFEEAEEEPDGDGDGDGADEGDLDADEDEAAVADEEEQLDEDEDDGMAALSAFARRQARIGAQVRALEAANLGPKDWFMRGEVRGGDRPLNSALEVAIDFEHASAPPPVVTQDATRSLEDIIRSRIAEKRFDDVQRKLPPPPGRKRRQVVLQDEKSAKGLADIYEEQYLKEKAAAEAAAKAAAAVATGAAPSAAAAAAAAAPPDDSAEGREARALFAALCAKLDALSHFQFAPKPFVEDMHVAKKDVPALAMEEVAPALVSTASLRAPEEVYAGGQGAGPAAGGVRGSAAGVIKAEVELTREEKTARRARKKRKGMASAAAADAKKRLITQQRQAAEAAAVAAGFKPSRSEAPGGGGPRAPRSAAQQSEYGKSTKVFARLQEAADAAKTASALGEAPTSAAKRLQEKVKARHGGAFNAAALKL
jgi:U3 small nucleolar RNA-associated protein MPP10